MQPLHPAPSLYLPSSESVGMHYHAMNENLVLEIESRLYARQANTLLTELLSCTPSDRIGSAGKAGVELSLLLPPPDCWILSEPLAQHDLFF